MSYDTQQATLVADLIRTLADARTATFTRVAVGAYSGATSKRTETTSTTSGVSVIVESARPEIVARGRTAWRRVFKLRASDLAWTPDAGDRITWDGVTWSIVPGGVTFMCGGKMLRLECLETLANNP